MKTKKCLPDLFESEDLFGHDTQNESDFKEADLELDLHSTEWIVEKIKNSKIYSQHLYAALCNNDFQKLDLYHVLKDVTWHCSWRYSGGIISDIRDEGDYMNWYLSGCDLDNDYYEENPELYENLTEEQKIKVNEVKQYVSEGTITREIMEDLEKMGWGHKKEL